MNNILLSGYGYRCKIVFDNDAFFIEVEQSKFWDIYCPDIIRVNENNTKKVDMEVSIDNSFAEPSFCQNLIKIPGKNISAQDLITVIDYVYEVARNKKGIYTINSSSIVYNKNKGVIFFGGATGMGKTTLARYFSKHKSFQLFSDDKTLIDIANLKLVGGSQYFYINKSNIKDEFPDQGDHVKFENGKNLIVDISMFVYGYITEEGMFEEHEIWSDEKLEWHIYESLTKRIRGVTRRIAGGNIPLPSLDTEYLSNKRIKDVKILCKKVKCLFIKAGLENVRKTVTKLIK